MDSRDELLDSLGGLYASGEYSDCTIVCGEYTFHAHKAIISPRSSFFRAAFTHDMQENATGTINLADDDPEAVQSMVHYLYHLDYTPPPTLDRSEDSDSLERTLQDSSTVQPASEEGPVASTLSSSRRCTKCRGKSGKTCSRCKPSPKFAEEHPNLSHHCRVYALAEKYNIVSLKKLVTWKFWDQSERWWRDCDFADFAEVAREVYATTPSHDPGLREVIVNTIRDHRQLLDNKEVQDVLGESELAFDVAMELHKPGLRTSNLRDGQRKSNWQY
ncbi:hypothetical protein G6O67_007716 [Ophiocordyceps sinensis]|uniref:BTB domain-containing protein n=1 Tax=Ophiocordyceps sinensis TaxID=72228 RepID=A0A8H4LUD4_9HYPO|nr:hypothetical protein G6O67_007716 [Ophiocordyceps sinensis]